MQGRTEHISTALRGARDFLNENADKLGAINDSDARKELNEAVDEIGAFAVNQSTRDMEMVGAENLQMTLEAELRKEHMDPIANFARAKLRGVAKYATLARATSRLKGQRLITAARAMAAAAEPYVSGLVTNGFPADTLAQLNAAADKLEAVRDESKALKSKHAGSTSGIDSTAKKGHEALRTLNAAIGRQFAKDKTFLSAWRVASRVRKQATVKPTVKPATEAAAAATSSTPTPVTPAKAA